MKYTYLKGTGTRVSRLCLGTMNFGNQVEETEAIRIVHRALDAGINFIDEANIYAGGLSETIVGKAIKGKRDKVVLASKVGGKAPPRGTGNSRYNIIKAVEDSLKRLQVETLDILYLHYPDYNTPIEESLFAVDRLIRDGKTMYLGISNHAAWQICRMLWVADKHNWQPPVVAQIPYNMLTRSADDEFLPFCRTMNVGVTVYNPLMSGLLTGKHDPGKPPIPGTRFDYNKEYYDRYWRESNFKAIAELKSIAQEAGITLLQLALRWLAAQPVIDSIVVGASRLEQLEENLAAWEGELSRDTLDACDKMWAKIRGESFRYNR